MKDKHVYTTDEIENMRQLLTDLVSIQVNRNNTAGVTHTAYDIWVLVESKLQTYILAEIAYKELAKAYPKIVESNQFLKDA